MKVNLEVKTPMLVTNWIKEDARENESGETSRILIGVTGWLMGPSTGMRKSMFGHAGHPSCPI